MRTPWLVIVCSLVALSLPACAGGPTQSPDVRYASTAPHVRESARLLATSTRGSTAPTAPRESVRLVTDHDRRAHK